MAIKKILSNLTRGDIEFNLIEDGDRIAVGVSGGKDSMLLLKVLKQYQMFPSKNFEFVAVFLDLGFGNVNKEILIKYCKEIDVKLHIEDSTEVYQILSQHKNSSSNLPCSICSRMKKAAINKVAHQLNCNKVAFAHHLDDALETLLMNTIYGGRIATFAPKMFLSDTKLTFIRPFILVREKEIISSCKSENIPIIKSSCPNDHITMREEAKQMLDYVYKNYPTSYQNYINMLLDEEHFDMWFNKKEFPIIPGYVVKKCSSQTDFFEMIKLRSNVFIKEFNFNIDDEYNNSEDLNPTSNHFILKKNKEVIGTISYLKISEKTYRIRKFALKKEYRKKGLGQALIKYIESLISMKDNPCLIFVNARDGSQEFYKKMGYAIKEELVESGIKHYRVEKTIKTAYKYKIPNKK